MPEDLSILSLLGQKATRAAATAYEEQDEGYDDDADNDPDDLDQGFAKLVEVIQSIFEGVVVIVGRNFGGNQHEDDCHCGSGTDHLQRHDAGSWQLHLELESRRAARTVMVWTAWLAWLTAR